MTVQPYLLPAGTVNNCTVYFYADSTKQFGPLVKKVTDQVLVIIDYTTVLSGTPITGFRFTSDAESNPPLYVTDPVISATGNVLSFLVSGGIDGQQYNVTIGLNPTGIPPSVTTLRNDVLTINMPSEGLCGAIPPMVTLLTSNSVIACCIHYYWGPTAPTAPFVMDQWYDTTNGTLYEWVEDGSDFWWQEIATGGPGTPPGSGTWIDAPSDGVLYSRRNALWIPDPIQVDAPGDGRIYVRSNDNWISDPLQIDAPADGQIWGRENNSWVPVTSGGGGLADAPADGNVYARENNMWVKIPVGVVYVYPGKPPIGQVINVPITFKINVLPNLAGTIIYASTVATANATFILNKISAGVTTAIGNIVVTAGSSIACTLSGSGGSLIIGDTLQMVAPSSQDATLADISLTILVMRT